jgi:hypothetical protein
MRDWSEPMRKAVEDFIALGPLPESSAVSESDLDRRVALLNAISRPVTDEEALALAQSFGPDECFGVAWSLLHLIETAPSHPRPPSAVFERSGWLRSGWTGRK